jgi:hypothetical protein
MDDGSQAKHTASLAVRTATGFGTEWDSDEALGDDTGVSSAQELHRGDYSPPPGHPPVARYRISNIHSSSDICLDNGMNVIEVRGLHKAFGRTGALNGLDLTVPRR